MGDFWVFLPIPVQYPFTQPLSQATFPIARLLMCLALTPYFMLSFKIHMANSYLGPKVVMIRRMVGVATMI
jgi:hypothetical protein